MDTHLAKGRPRNEHIDAKILSAAKALLAELGYIHLSIEAVARAADVSKATVYLRYKNKATLAVEAAISEWQLGTVPNTGSVRNDLVGLLSGSIPLMQTPFGAPLIGALLAEEPRDPTAIAVYRDTVIRARRDMYMTVLRRAVDSGQVRADADLDMAYEMLTGWWYARHLVGGEICDRDISGLVDQCLGGISTAPTTDSSP